MNDFFSSNRPEKKEEVSKPSVKPLAKPVVDLQETVVMRPSSTPRQAQLDRAIATLIKEGNSAEDAAQIVKTSFIENIKRWGFTLEEYKDF
jgi:hypothetical protein